MKKDKREWLNDFAGFCKKKLKLKANGPFKSSAIQAVMIERIAKHKDGDRVVLQFGKDREFGVPLGMLNTKI